MKQHPVFIILVGLFICSLGFNISMWQSNKKLVYQIQKLEAGPAKGLFLTPDEKTDKRLSDEEIQELIRQMLDKIQKERMT
jgi:hypothetical protein